MEAGECRRILRELLSAGPEFKYTDAVADSDSLMETGVVDSFDMITLVVRIEERFAIRVAPDDMDEETFRSLESIAAYITAKLAAAGRS